MSLSPAELTRYSRHLSLKELGPAGQQRLKDARVLVIGAGGLGSPALLYLAAAGVGTLGIIEFDQVDISNLQRQVLYDTDAVGQPKAVRAQQRIKALNPHVEVIVHAVALDDRNVLDLIEPYDVVLDGTDQFPVRYLINDACVLAGKPLVSAAIHRFEGQAFTYVPAQGPCYRCLFPTAPAAGAVPNCAEAGVLGVLPGLMGVIQATEAIKLITGMGRPLTGRLLTYDALDLHFDEFTFARDPACAVCGPAATIRQPQLGSEACAMPGTEPSAMAVDISVEQLQQQLAQASLQLIDVREPHEYAAGHVPGAINVPLSLGPEALRALPTQPLAFICKGGARSMEACRRLRALRADANIINVSGGTLAWQARIDPSVLVL